MTKNLGTRLGKLFHAPALRNKDPQRKAREQAKKLATTHGIEIERMREGGFNVWPPEDFKGNDVHEGDHYV